MSPYMNVCISVKKTINNVSSCVSLQLYIVQHHKIKIEILRASNNYILLLLVINQIFHG